MYKFFLFLSPFFFLLKKLKSGASVSGASVSGASKSGASISGASKSGASKSGASGAGKLEELVWQAYRSW
jgi:hypothetical protein